MDARSSEQCNTVHLFFFGFFCDGNLDTVKRSSRLCQSQKYFMEFSAEKKKSIKLFQIKNSHSVACSPKWHLSCDNGNGHFTVFHISWQRKYQERKKLSVAHVSKLYARMKLKFSYIASTKRNACIPNSANYDGHGGNMWLSPLEIYNAWWSWQVNMKNSVGTDVCKKKEVIILIRAETRLKSAHIWSCFTSFFYAHKKRNHCKVKFDFFF